MSDINWQENAVCYFDGEQWFANENESLSNLCGDGHEYESAFEFDDFQLTEITIGDFTPASELDTEQKYNDIIEVFGLFGFKFGSCATKEKPIEKSGFCLSIVDNEIWNASGSALKRQLTYHQIIAIGKLKRMMLEREKPKFKLGISAEDAVSALNNAGNIGQKHDQSKPSFSLIPLEPLQDVISALEFGAAKYGAGNWKHVENPQQRYLDAFMRHTMAWQSGELVDDESGLPHLAHAQCCLLFLQHFDK